MKPFIVLIALFLFSVITTRVLNKKISLQLCGRIAMSGMLLFTSIGHFMFPDGMAMMIPEFVPAKVAIIYITGLFEILAAIGLLVPHLRKLTGWLLIVFFVLILPANIYAAVHEVNFETASLDGPGAHYLWFRIPFQFFLIGWVYFSTIFKYQGN